MHRKGCTKYVPFGEWKVEREKWKSVVIARTSGTKRSQQDETAVVALLLEIATSATDPGLPRNDGSFIGFWINPVNPVNPVRKGFLWNLEC